MNVSLVVANVNQIKSGISLNVDVLGSIIDDSVITRHEVINTVDSVSANVINAVSTYFCNKKVRCEMDWYILHTLLLVIVLLLVIAIICYHYLKHRSKQKNVLLY